MHIHIPAIGNVVTIGVDNAPAASDNRLGKLVADLHAAATPWRPRIP